MNVFTATTIVAVRRGTKSAIAGDGQVTFGQNTIMKHNAKKIRKLREGNIIAGFAGSVADAFTLFDRFDEQLKKNSGNLTRAAVELAKEWRSDRILRRLEALLLVADKQKMFVISGNGELIEAEDGIAAIGSGASYALAAARSLYKFTELPADQIAYESLKIASEICVYTNDNIMVEIIE
ncbi:MAG: ATP-dependent protease subunit HslV [Syntrophomonadaceae bacterium]|jgi:ATP-dependent HslUV protease subunit HslV|nr:ATP-dependent protease subunit HslV [Syntrophomonadaceae bacterium]